MWWIFIILLVGYFIIKSVFSTAKDKQDIRMTPIEEKFRFMLNVLNTNVFDGKAKVYKINGQAFNFMVDQSNQMLQFIYSHSGLSVEWKYKYYQKEVKHKKYFSNVRNISVFDQQQMAYTLISEMNRVIETHKQSVLKPLSNSLQKDLHFAGDNVISEDQEVEVKITMRHLILYIESKMREDIEQIIDNKEQLGSKVKNLDLLMCMESSKVKLKDKIKQGQLDFSNSEIDICIDEAYKNLFNRFFRTEETDKAPDFSSTFVGTIRLYNHSTDDPAMDIFKINVLAGKAPNKLLIHREEAEEAGLYLNHCYKVNCTFCEYGNDLTNNFQFEAIKELSALNWGQELNILGTPEIIEVEKKC